ncbi:SPFH domain-containing protein [Streptomyces sp. NPDC056061]|uniref:SPFH domain-containing protein n=1 Tax=Streptomyces sp. NPDC056061 TaxID=3345700 RepID=UPI0035D6AF05
MSRHSSGPRAGGARRPTATPVRRPGGGSSREKTEMTEAGMGSTVPDSSGTTENERGAKEREAARMRDRTVVDGRGTDRDEGHGGPRPDTTADDGTGPGRGAAAVRESAAAAGAPVGTGTAPDADTGSGADTGPGAGPDAVVDLVLDLVPGEDTGTALGATSVSVPVGGAAAGPVPAADGASAGGSAPDAAFAPGTPVRAAAGSRAGRASELPHPSTLPLPSSPLPSPSRPRDTADRGPGGVERARGAAGSGIAPAGAGTRRLVIGREGAASIPVHLLFRGDSEGADATLPGDMPLRGTRGTGAEAGTRRPPVPRGPQVQPSTRPAPLGDPRLTERSGPALPGWVAVLTGLIGTAAAAAVLWWIGAFPVPVLTRLGIDSRPYQGVGLGAWVALAALATLVLLAIGGLSRGRVGYAWVLTLFGEYRGSVRRTGLMWISPLLLRRRVDVRLRHWRSEPLPAVDANGTALRVVVLVVWRTKDTARAVLGVADHETYLREQVEAAMARVLSQLPADAFHEDAHTLRNVEAVGDALTRMLKADCVPVGIEVYSAQPTGIEYAPEVAAAMQRCRIAAIDAKQRDSVLTSVVDAVDDTVNRLTERGIVELDDYERKALVKDLTVAFYTGRGGGEGA